MATIILNRPLDFQGLGNSSDLFSFLNHGVMICEQRQQNPDMTVQIIVLGS